ncbi:MAG TPA: SRPBCC family protein [Phenylobacterium sp.]|nr:SRPBCC family protein [Phenylobacterium sp.]
MTEHLEDASKSDAPLTSTVHQRDLAKEAAEERDWSDAAVVGRTITVNAPREEVYAFWRDFRNFPSFMENIESVTPGDGQRSHWVLKAPAGKSVEWDSVLTEDRPGEVIAWEAVEEADVKNTGRIEFSDAPGGRGTQITATIVYDPPGGDLGMLIAKLFQKEPKVQARRELRRFKQLMETGEVSTSRSPAGAGRDWA